MSQNLFYDQRLSMARSPFAHPSRSNSIQQVFQMNEFRFFHCTSDDSKFYRISCKEILQGSNSLDDHDYDHTFFYQCSNNSSNYHVTCNLLSHSWVVKVLNSKIYGIDLDIDNFKRKESLSLSEKLNLEQELKQILPFRFTQNCNPKSKIGTDFDRNINTFHGHTASITNSQKNCFPHQNEVGSYAHNLAYSQIPQRIPENKEIMRAGPDGNVNAFHGYNKITTTQAINFNYDLPQQNGVEGYNVTQDDLNNFSHQIPERPDYSTNMVTTQAVSVNQNYNNHQDVANRVGNYTHIACSQQRVDLNFSHHRIPERKTGFEYTDGNVGINNGLAGIPCNDHIYHDVNGIRDYTHAAYPQETGLDYTNGNVSDNVTTTQDVSMADLNNSQDLNVRDCVYLQDALNNSTHHVPERVTGPDDNNKNVNYGNDMMTTQAADTINQNCDDNGLPYNYRGDNIALQDVNGTGGYNHYNYQVSHSL